jgi:hypothetical protein
MLITHGESGRSSVARTRDVVSPTSFAGQFEQPHGPIGRPTLSTIPVRYYIICPVAPANAGAQVRATRSRSPGFPLPRERRNKRTSNWRWSRSCGANGRRRSGASPSRRQSPLRLAGTLGDDLEICGCRGIGLAAALFPILQGRERDAVDAGEFLLGHPRLCRMARTSGTSTTSTRIPLGFPSACSQASVRLSISSLGRAAHQARGHRAVSSRRPSARKAALPDHGRNK